MNLDDIRLISVNWEHGMLLTPDHFRRQERYFESSILWILRYAADVFGLVGGGPRLPDAERGSVRHDPVVVVDEDENTLSITVSQCRGITPAGCIVEITPDHPASRRFSKAELESVAECGVYVICDPHEKIAVDGSVDEFNPQMQTERRPAYTLTLQPHADDAPYSIAAARLRRARYGTAFEKDSGYIPPCTSMVSHSELASAWRRLVEEISLLAGRYAELHRAMREFLHLFTERGIESEVDAEVVRFVDRMVVALENCAYEILDPSQRPERFFAYLQRLFHSAAVYLDLSPETQRYFELLRQTGESEFITLSEQQKRILQTTRRWQIHDDVGAEVRNAVQSISALRRLERALEGKYIDFRLSASIEAMNFIFDRGGKVLYKMAAKPSRVQGFGDEMAIHFAGLRLEGREKYRLILVSQQDAVYEKGARINVEIRINEGSGFRRSPIRGACEAMLPEQRNFELDFDAPDVPTITDLRVIVPGHEPIHTALLFVRHRFFAAPAEDARVVAPLRPDAPGAEPGPYVHGATVGGPDVQPAYPAGEERRRVQPPWGDRGQPAADPNAPRDTRRPATPADTPPWDRQERRSGEPPQPPPRRRRLEP